MGFVARKCFQCGGKIVEGEQRFAILLQAFSGLLVFDRVGLDEGVERGLGLGFRHPDHLQGPLGLCWLLAACSARLPSAAAQSFSDLSQLPSDGPLESYGNAFAPSPNISHGLGASGLRI
jgi:hypothetical protein